MKNALLTIFFVFFISTGFSQASDYSRQDYMDIIEQADRISLFNIDTDNISVESDCGANYDSGNQVLYTTQGCRGKLWMENNRSLETAYEFILDFSLTPDYQDSDKTYPWQAMLGNSPSGFTWLGITKEGQLELSTRDQEGWTDVLKVFKADKVHFNKENHLRFIQFADGYFYIELNSYSRLSYDLGSKSIKQLPIVGLSNRMQFYANIKISRLEMNAIEDSAGEDDMLTELENLTASMQEEQLLALDTNEERLEFRNLMGMMSDDPCYGDCEDGFGIYDFDEGLQYMGQWQNGTFDGKGLVYSNGALYYDGDFYEGVFHGKGKVYEDGQLIFDGEFKNGEPILD